MDFEHMLKKQTDGQIECRRPRSPPAWKQSTGRWKSTPVARKHDLCGAQMEFRRSHTIFQRIHQRERNSPCDIETTSKENRLGIANNLSDDKFNERETVSVTSKEFRKKFVTTFKRRRRRKCSRDDTNKLYDFNTTTKENESLRFQNNRLD